MCNTSQSWGDGGCTYLAGAGQPQGIERDVRVIGRHQAPPGFDGSLCVIYGDQSLDGTQTIRLSSQMIEILLKIQS